MLLILTAEYGWIKGMTKYTVRFLINRCLHFRLENREIQVQNRVIQDGKPLAILQLLWELDYHGLNRWLKLGE